MPAVPRWPAGPSPLRAGSTFGTLADGGEFELVYVWLDSFQGDRVVGMELFEPEHLDVAPARFEELRPRTSDGDRISLRRVATARND
jgi:hypothetical protein